jgi:hypothetical protein
VCDADEVIRRHLTTEAAKLVDAQAEPLGWRTPIVAGSAWDGDMVFSLEHRRARRPDVLPMNRRLFVTANWRLPLIFAALAKVPLQASGSRAQCRRHAQGNFPCTMDSGLHVGIVNSIRARRPKSQPLIRSSNTK